MPSDGEKRSKGKSAAQKTRARVRDRQAEWVLASLLDLYEKQGVRAVWAAIHALLKDEPEEGT